MKRKELTCIVCPNGCPLEIEFEEEPALKVIEVQGHTCDKGPKWAEQELTNPMRTIASNVSVKNGDFPLVSVRTDGPIPKQRIFDVMTEIRSATVKAPVAIGQVLIKNPAGTDCNIIATRHVNPA
ncbi:conserved hypothetical protein [delta proteobacterium NaphS2]|nr:conserved hypothetical protein [delta proteobacterium NaphS2]